MENLKKLNNTESSNNLNSSGIETESVISLNNMNKDESSLSLFADTAKSSANSSQTFFNSPSMLKINKPNNISNTSISESILNFQNSESGGNEEKFVFIDTKPSNKNKLSDTANFFASENSESNGTSKKFVSFNKDIDVRLYPKNTKLSNKMFEPIILPLAQDTLSISSTASSPTSTSTPNSTSFSNSMNLTNTTNELTNHLPNQNQNNLHLNKSFNLNDITQLFKFQNKNIIQNEIKSQIMNNNNNNNFNKNEESNRFSSRASICSNRKLPGETSVKDLEPTLKMIIIKELSVDKLDGNDWRMFAKRFNCLFIYLYKY